ncbi:DUF2784 domain-containing protein [Ornithinimicrobium cryptoxanthini]|uniref:DUF2784 domain-containing protein n=1 Tax=Ornithinimicrobium cryptoxanthini TaxID=2934161 RepID=UPI0021189882|nr:DUF2784 domain-containing protein [Ornithinimicrobium cryptoxanthini]
MSETVAPAMTRRLPYQVAAHATMLVHLGFVALVVFGGFLAWAQPWALWLQLPAVAWAVAGQVRSLECPLTALEDWARVRAGRTLMCESGFIDHYLTGVVYPRSWKSAMPPVALAVAIASWVGLALH